MTASSERRERDVVETLFGDAQEVGVSDSQHSQCIAVGGAQQIQRLAEFSPPTRSHRQLTRSTARRGRFLQHDMRVGPAGTERIHADEPRVIGGFQRSRLGRDHQPKVVPVDFGIRFVEVQVGRGDAVLCRQCPFDEAGNPRCAFEVPQVRLHRTHQTAFPLGSIASQHSSECQTLDRITDRRTSTVSFDVIHLQGIDPGLVINRIQHRDLCEHIRHRESFRQIAVLIDCRAAHPSVNCIAISECSLQRLQDHDADTFTANISIGRGIKGFAVLIGIQKPGLRQHDRRFRSQHQIDAAGDGHIGFPVPQATASQMHGDQRTRTRGIERDARPLQVEVIGNPIGQRRDSRSHRDVRIDLIAMLTGRLHAEVVIHERPDEDRRSRSIQLIAPQSGIFHRLVSHLEEHPLLRIDALSLSREVAEELGVELINTVDEATSSVANAPDLFRIRIMKPSMIPTVCRHITDGVDPAQQGLPISSR